MNICVCFPSSLASSLLNSIADFLENGIDDFTTSLYNLTINDDSDDRLDLNDMDMNNNNDNTDSDNNNDNNDSDNNEEAQDQQKLMIQEIRYDPTPFPTN